MSKTKESLKRAKKLLKKANKDLLELKKNSVQQQLNKPTNKNRVSELDILQVEVQVAELQTNVEELHAERAKRKLEKMLRHVHVIEVKAERLRKNAEKAVQKLNAQRGEVKVEEGKYNEHQRAASAAKKFAREKKEILKQARKNKTKSKVQITSISIPKETPITPPVAAKEVPDQAAEN